jgi:hypothetical protein
MVGTLSTRALLMLAAALVAAVAALGYTQMSRAHADARDDVRRVVKTYEVALMTGDGKTACAQLTASARSEMLDAATAAGMGGSCQQVGAAMKRYVDYLMSQAPSPARAAEVRRTIEDPPVEVASLDGDSATARIEGVAKRPIPLTRTGEGWKISGLTFPGRQSRGVPSG